MPPPELSVVPTPSGLNAGDNKTEEYRTPPSNLVAEQQLLGALLVNNELIHHIGDFLRPEHFFEPAHQHLYRAVQHYVDRGMVANPVTLKRQFDAEESLSEAGGAEYLIQLAAQATAIINVQHYGRLIHDLAVRRRLIDVGDEMVNTSYDADLDAGVHTLIEDAEQQLFQLSEHGVTSGGYLSLGEAVTQAVEHADHAFRNAGEVNGLTTGFIDMDKMLGGFQKSDLLILAGRPSMGKTALALSLAYNSALALKTQAEAAGEGGETPEMPGVAFFSLEMSAEQLATRLLSKATALNTAKIRRGELLETDFAKLVEGSRELAALPLYIDDTPALSISAVRTRARRMKSRHGIGMVIVDYLQLLRGSSTTGDNRVQEISEITQGLKAIAKELNVPVLALSQLSRAVEQREDKRPLLSDLRESGSIEQDADVVMFVFREAYYLSRRMPREDDPKFDEWQRAMEQVFGLTEVIIAKQRNGPVGTAKLTFNAETASFANYQDPHMAPEFHGG